MSISPRMSWSAIISILVTLPATTVKSKATLAVPPCTHTNPARPSRSAVRAAFAPPENLAATSSGPTKLAGAPIAIATGSATSWTSGLRNERSDWKSPDLAAARKASTILCCRWDQMLDPQLCELAGEPCWPAVDTLRATCRGSRRSLRGGRRTCRGARRRSAQPD